MGSKAGWCNKTSTPEDIFKVTPLPKEWQTKTKDAPSLC